jgi:hypothetical protein
MIQPGIVLITAARHDLSCKPFGIAQYCRARKLINIEFNGRCTSSTAHLSASR